MNKAPGKHRYSDRMNRNHHKDNTNPLITDKYKENLIKYEDSLKKRKKKQTNGFDLELNYPAYNKRHILSLENSPLREHFHDSNDSIPEIRSSAKIFTEV